VLLRLCAVLPCKVEKTYPCLGITCEEVGVYKSSGLTACSDATPPATTAAAADDGVADESGALVASFAMVLLNVFT
jgi:hypothetical protein